MNHDGMRLTIVHFLERYRVDDGHCLNQCRLIASHRGAREVWVMRVMAPQAWSLSYPLSASCSPTRPPCPLTFTDPGQTGLI